MIFLEDDVMLKGINNQYDKITRFACQTYTYWRIRSWEIFTAYAVR